MSKIFMDIAIISSKKDEASMNIRENLMKFFKESDKKFHDEKVYSYNNIKLYTVDSDLTYYENIDQEIESDFFIFISKHKSQSGIPTLSLHSIGNWNENKLGGKKGKLVLTSAIILRKTFLVLNEIGKNSGYEIVYEATHHGPYLEKPSFFIEIGSTSKEWSDKNAGNIIATTLLKSISIKDEEVQVAIGIGGLHTCPEFNKVVLRNKIAISHICPKYILPQISKEMIEEAIKKTEERIDFVILDWKGLGKEKTKVLGVLKELNLDYKRTTSL